jgi:hypothetical protein
LRDLEGASRARIQPITGVAEELKEQMEERQ